MPINNKRNRRSNLRSPNNDQNPNLHQSSQRKLELKTHNQMNRAYEPNSGFGDNRETRTPARKAPRIFSAPTVSEMATSTIIRVNTALVPI